MDASDPADVAAERVMRLIRDALAPDDPDAQVRATRRPDGLLETTVVTRLFEGLDSLEREALLWPILRALPTDDLLRMTYSLLLTPAEAGELFGG